MDLEDKDDFKDIFSDFDSSDDEQPNQILKLILANLNKLR
jgi:hypothetical protein